MFKKSSRYLDVDLNASIISACLTSGRDVVKSHSKIKTNQLQKEHNQSSCNDNITGKMLIRYFEQYAF